VHEGAARSLVRRLKYEGIGAVAEVVAAELVDRIPPDSESLVPIARTLVRRVKYGVDPASLLAQALSRRSGLPVHHALASPMWSRPNAGSGLVDRRPPQLRRRFESPGAVLVDDVFTTGSTIDRAATTLGGVRVALTVTGVP
jgi:predicted amidophosphoribosyltransferase